MLNVWLFESQIRELQFYLPMPSKFMCSIDYYSLQTLQSPGQIVSLKHFNIKLHIDCRAGVRK